MLRKLLFALLVVTVFGAAFAAPAHAQSQAVSFNVGAFNLRGIDGRCPNVSLTSSGSPLLVNCDILGTELNAGQIDALLFNLKDFNNATFGGEWLIGVGDMLEAGVGVAYYASGQVPSVSANYVNFDTGAEITQEIRLRVVPITATIRFLPLGRAHVVEPYIGGGIGIFAWRYSEAGQFLFPNDVGGLDIRTNTYANSGTAIGPVILGGVRIPFGRYAVGGEIRWQKATGDLSLNDFLSDHVDLGGVNYQATFVVRFGGK